MRLMLLKSSTINLSMVTVKFFMKFEKFDHLVNRLNKVFGFYYNQPHFEFLWKVCKVFLMQFHGQAELDCGFSVNLKVLNENMQELSLVSQQMLYDHVTSNNVTIHEFRAPILPP